MDHFVVRSPNPKHQKGDENSVAEDVKSKRKLSSLPEEASPQRKTAKTDTFTSPSDVRVTHKEDDVEERKEVSTPAKTRKVVIPDSSPAKTESSLENIDELISEKAEELRRVVSYSETKLDYEIQNYALLLFTHEKFLESEEELSGGEFPDTLILVLSALVQDSDLNIDELTEFVHRVLTNNGKGKKAASTLTKEAVKLRIELTAELKDYGYKIPPIFTDHVASVIGEDVLSFSLKRWELLKLINIQDMNKRVEIRERRKMRNELCKRLNSLANELRKLEKQRVMTISKHKKKLEQEQERERSWKEKEWKKLQREKEKEERKRKREDERLQKKEEAIRQKEEAKRQKEAEQIQKAEQQKKSNDQKSLAHFGFKREQYEKESVLSTGSIFAPFRLGPGMQFSRNNQFSSMKDEEIEEALKGPPPSVEMLRRSWHDRPREKRIRSRKCRIHFDLPVKVNPVMKYLMFAENYRPAYFGTFSKNSNVIGPRRPFSSDVKLFNYDEDSDMEWDEVQSGDSLSSVDEKMSDGGDEEDGDDGFVVSNAYISQTSGSDQSNDSGVVVDFSGISKVIPNSTGSDGVKQNGKRTKSDGLFTRKLVHRSDDIQPGDEYTLLKRYSVVRLTENPVNPLEFLTAVSCHENTTNGDDIEGISEEPPRNEINDEEPVCSKVLEKFFPRNDKPEQILLEFESKLHFISPEKFEAVEHLSNQLTELIRSGGLICFTPECVVYILSFLAHPLSAFERREDSGSQLSSALGDMDGARSALLSLCVEWCKKYVGNHTDAKGTSGVDLCSHPKFFAALKSSICECTNHEVVRNGLQLIQAGGRFCEERGADSSCKMCHYICDDDVILYIAKRLKNERLFSDALAVLARVAEHCKDLFFSKVKEDPQLSKLVLEGLRSTSAQLSASEHGACNYLISLL